MININHYGIYSVLLLQDWIYTKKPSKKESFYAQKADERTAQNIIPVVEARELEKKVEFRTQADHKNFIIPTNIRLEGSYETMAEAEFIKSKLIKSMRSLDKTEHKSPDWLISIDARKTRIATPTYTNGVSNVTHHLEWLEDLKDHKFESFLHNTKSNRERHEDKEFETFEDFIRYREELFKPRSLRDYEPTQS